MSGFHLFTVAKIPVWISPWFLVIPLLAIRGGGLRHGLALTLCVLASVLVHELGHAVMARRYRLGPQIMVHAFGGHTSHQRAATNREDAIIIAAGPLFGLSLGVLALAVLYALLPPELRGLSELTQFVRSAPWVRGAPMEVTVLGGLVYFNVLWSAFNLLPVYPMDGGRLFRLGMLKALKPGQAERFTHVVGLVGVAAIALFSYRFPHLLPGGFFLMVILAGMAFTNIQGLTQGTTEPVRKDNGFARELITAAERAYERADDDEAARLCHQIRAEGNVPPQVLARTWAILGVIATRKGEYEEALSYLRRAPASPDVVEAMAQCFYQLGMYDALSALTTTKAFTRLPNDTRRTILDALHEAVA